MQAPRIGRTGRFYFWGLECNPFFPPAVLTNIRPCAGNRNNEDQIACSSANGL